MSRPSYYQLEKLVQFLEENPGIAKGHLRSAQARLETKRKWEEISDILNAIGGAIKDTKAWAKFWADKKYALKKLVAQRHNSANRTGGGVDAMQPLCELDERLVSLMGGHTFANGDQDLSVPLGVPLEPEEPLFSLQENELLGLLEEQPSTSHAVESLHSQEQAPSTPRRSPRKSGRLHRSQLSLEKERLIKIEEKRVEAELATAAGWAKLVQSIDNLANAIITTGDKIAEALKKTNK